ncbi:MAG TPA: hypothetical protein VNQ34_01760 [Xanthobacteraceae bacterium]|jgi:uncharacterized membrane protein YciS (DUF1049 family)|nr:hypothetical protein [Xanthobacteraceae bacterium]
MPFNAPTPHEMQIIRSAQLHRQIGSACTQIVISLVLIASICVLALTIGTVKASAAAQNLVMVDEGMGFSTILALIGIAICLMLLMPFACSGLTPNHVRRRRTRR